MEIKQIFFLKSQQILILPLPLTKKQKQTKTLDLSFYSLFEGKRGQEWILSRLPHIFQRWITAGWNPCPIFAADVSNAACRRNPFFPQDFIYLTWCGVPTRLEEEFLSDLNQPRPSVKGLGRWGMEWGQPNSEKETNQHRGEAPSFMHRLSFTLSHSRLHTYTPPREAEPNVPGK